MASGALFFETFQGSEVAFSETIRVNFHAKKCSKQLRRSPGESQPGSVLWDSYLGHGGGSMGPPYSPVQDI